MDINNKKIIEKSRYERKFLLSGVTLKDAEQVVILNPLGFKEIYYQRQVNSIYLDTQDFDSYHENISGVGERAKLRIRWYGDDISSLVDPNFEIKIKNGLLGRKLIYSMNNFFLEQLFSRDRVSRLLTSKVPDIYKIKYNLNFPVILISYDRKYFLSSNKLYRLTIDTNLKFFQPDLLHNSYNYWDGDGSIIELKYLSSDENDLKLFSNQFPFRLSRCSKYIIGVESLFGVLI